jgi:hypothetical protein
MQRFGVARVRVGLHVHLHSRQPLLREVLPSDTERLDWARRARANSHIFAPVAT